MAQAAEAPARLSQHKGVCHTTRCCRTGKPQAAPASASLIKQAGTQVNHKPAHHRHARQAGRQAGGRAGSQAQPSIPSCPVPKPLWGRTTAAHDQLARSFSSVKHCISQTPHQSNTVSVLVSASTPASTPASIPRKGRSQLTRGGPATEKELVLKQFVSMVLHDPKQATKAANHLRPSLAGMPKRDSRQARWQGIMLLAA